MTARESLFAGLDERVLRAIAAADQASTSMHAYGPMNDKWLRGFADALAGEGLTIVEAAEDHVLELRNDGYGLQHPARCRPNLLDCPYEQAARDLSGDEAEHGRWVVELHPDGVFEFLERVS